MKEFNLGDVVRLKLKGTISAKYDGREGVIVKKTSIMSDYAYGVHVVGAEVNVYNPHTHDIMGKTSVLDGIFEDGLELIKE